MAHLAWKVAANDRLPILVVPKRKEREIPASLVAESVGIIKDAAKNQEWRSQGGALVPGE